MSAPAPFSVFLGASWEPQPCLLHRCGVPQGELQASLSALRTIVTIVTPMLWARIYAFGVTMNVPSLFYYVSAAAGVVQLILLQRLVSAPDPETKEAE